MNKYTVAALAVVALLFGFVIVSRGADDATMSSLVHTELPELVPGQEVATFATGCFWCMEAVFQETRGVISAVSGYGGGQEVAPTYQDVYTGKTGHRESVQVIFDAAAISYAELLDIYWQGIDPTDPDGQFVDKGFPYTAAIFYNNKQQQVIAEASRGDLAASGRFDEPIVTPIVPFTTFYEAEAYHQDFYKKSSEHYKNYEQGSGRDQFRDSVWNDIQAQ